MVICLQRGANDLYMVQLMPLSSHHLLLHSNEDWFNVSGADLPRLSWRRGIKLMSVSYLFTVTLKFMVDILLLPLHCCWDG